MATGNILSAQINVTAPGAKEAFASVSDGAKRTEATVKQLGPQISKLGSSLTALKFAVLDRKEELIRTTDIVRAKELNVQIRNLEKEIKRLGVAGTSSMGAIGSGATKAFTGLRSLANILPGIGIAGLFGAAFAGIESLFRGVGAKAEELAKKLKELIIPIEDIRSAATAGTAEELSKVTALTNAVLNHALSYKERNEALRQLKEINKAYFGDMTLEQAELGALKKAVDEYTAAIINQAVIKAFSDEIGKLAVELAKEEKALDDAGKEVVKYKEKLDDARKSTKGTTESIRASSLGLDPQKVARATGRVGDVTKAFERQEKVVSALRGQFGQLMVSIQKAVNEGLNFKPLEDPKLPPKIKPIPIEFIPKFDLKPLSDLLRKPGAFEKIALNIQGIIIPEFHIRKTDGQKLHDLLEKEISSSATIKPIPYPIELVLKAQRITETLANINKIIGDAFSDSIANVGEAIGEALSGGDIGKAFQQFGRILGGAVQAIGKQLIALGTAALLAKMALKSLFSNPAIQIAAGVALVAIGAALKNLLGGGVKGFAEGGFTGPGGKYDIAGMVHKGEYVIPAFAVNRLGVGYLNNLAFGRGIRGYADGGFVTGGAPGSSAIQINGQFKVSGNDLVLVLANANRSQGRLT